MREAVSAVSFFPQDDWRLTLNNTGISADVVSPVVWGLSQDEQEVLLLPRGSRVETIIPRVCLAYPQRKLPASTACSNLEQASPCAAGKPTSPKSARRDIIAPRTEKLTTNLAFRIVEKTPKWSRGA